MRLHLLGLPHTITRDQFSHCAFTAKVQKFSPMMRPLGYDVLHYGVGGAQSGATMQIDVLGEDEQAALLGHRHEDHQRFVGTDANVGHPVYQEFNRRLRPLLEQHVAPGDLVLHPFGHAHVAATGTHRGINIESGIGYPTTCLPFRIYESLAWMHRDQGVHRREGNCYEWVIPNYFVAEDWPVVRTPGAEVRFLGRIGETKGCQTIVELAKARPDVTFVLCGQGDPAPYLAQAPNLRYEPPKVGRERAAYLGEAALVLMPSNFVEPFGGVAVEAMLCGTPVATVPYGAFTETVQHGVTGFHCRVLADWTRAVDEARTLDRGAIAAIARARYSLPAVGPQYDRVFRQIADLARGGGWYTSASTWR